jgi:hypothetical protein
MRLHVQLRRKPAWRAAALAVLVALATLLPATAVLWHRRSQAAAELAAAQRALAAEPEAAAAVSVFRARKDTFALRLGVMTELAGRQPDLAALLDIFSRHAEPAAATLETLHWREGKVGLTFACRQPEAAVRFAEALARLPELERVDLRPIPPGGRYQLAAEWVFPEPGAGPEAGAGVTP